MPDQIISDETIKHQSEAKEQKQHKKTLMQSQFANWSREEQLAAFFAWLPQELHDAPGIDWSELAPEVMGYLIKVIGKSPDAAVMAVVAASVHGAISQSSQVTHIRNVGSLLRDLRATTSIQCLADLGQEQVWFTWAAVQKKTERARQRVGSYLTASTGHFLSYVRRLTPSERQHMQQYALPPPPADISKKCFPYKQTSVAQKQERKATTDILVPLYPVLRQMVRLRKQLAERLLLRIREARHCVEAGEASLPYHFEHTDTIPEVSRDATTVAEVRLLGREVTMQLVLWDKRTWVKEHPERYSDTLVEAARYHMGAYTEEHNCFFVQFDSASCDSLWFGDLVEQRVFKVFSKWRWETAEPEDYQARWMYARSCGFSHGCVCGPTGLLDSGDSWFGRQAERGKELLVECWASTK